MKFTRAIMFLLLLYISFSLSLVGCSQLPFSGSKYSSQTVDPTSTPDLDSGAVVTASSSISSTKVTELGDLLNPSRRSLLAVDSGAVNSVAVDSGAAKSSAKRQAFEANLWGLKNTMKAPSSDDIFVSINRGNDSNDGTKENPVKSIQKGFSLISGKRARVVIAEGNYKESGIELKGKGKVGSEDSISIEGEGKVVISQTLGPILKFDNCHNIMLKNIIFDGTEGTLKKEEDDSLVIFNGGSSHILVKLCQFNNSKGKGVIFCGSWFRPNSLKNRVDTYLDDEYVDKNVLISPVCTNVTVMDCSALNDEREGFMATYWCRDILMENSTIKNCNRVFLKISGASVMGKNMYSKNITYRNIKIISDESVCPSQPAFWFDCDHWNVLIENCYIDLPKGSAMIIESNVAKGITIRNNVFKVGGGIGIFDNPGAIIENNVIWVRSQLISHFSMNGDGKPRDCDQHPGMHISKDTTFINNKIYYDGSDFWGCTYINTNFMTFHSSGNIIHIPNINNAEDLYKMVQKQIADPTLILHKHKHNSPLEMVDEKNDNVK